MSGLLLTITPFALVDSIGVTHFATLSVLLGSRRRYSLAICYLASVFIGYFAIGYLFLLGLDQVFEEIEEYLVYQWNKPIEPEGLVLQLVIGVLLIVFSLRASRPGKVEARAAQKTSGWENPGYVPVFLWGAIPAFLPSITMLPYFASIDLVLKAELGMAGSVGALVYYNSVFLVLPTTLIVVRVVSPKRADRIFGAVMRFFSKWGKGMLAVLFVLLGAVLIADAVALFFGYPILPYNPDLAAG